MIRVGFIINSRVPSKEAISRGMPFYRLWTGWDDRGSPMSFMRFHWVGDALRRSGLADYRLFRPGLPVDAVVFLKSMGPHCEELTETLRSQGVPVIFEANVDYYSANTNSDVPMRDLAPTEDQRRMAIAMTAGADGVIASSKHLAGICGAFNDKVFAVTDHVNLGLRPKRWGREPYLGGKLQVWWSGMASKAFELLVAAPAMRNLKDKLHLNLVTDDLSARQTWTPDVRTQFEQFLAETPHTVHPFQDVKDLLRKYAAGGIIISPRTLDAPYNRSHTEWKITLGMACGLPAIASPVPSYESVAAAASDGAVTICRSDAEWQVAFEKMSDPSTLAARAVAASDVVERCYSTDHVAGEHLKAVQSIVSGKAS